VRIKRKNQLKTITMSDKTPDKNLFKKYIYDSGEENVETLEKEETKTESTESKFSYSNNIQNPTINVGVPATGAFDEKFYNSLQEVIEKNNIEGIDYFELAKSKKAMDVAMPGTSEAVRFNATYQSLKANTPTLTKEHILQTADFYLKKLDEEEGVFNTDMQGALDKEVTSRNNEAKAKQDLIAKKQEEILKIQTEIGTLQAESSTLITEAQQVNAKIEATAKNFKVTLEIVKNQINNDKKAIEQYIVA
jgi:hypothetical protein